MLSSHGYVVRHSVALCVSLVLLNNGKPDCLTRRWRQVADFKWWCYFEDSYESDKYSVYSVDACKDRMLGK